MSMRIPLFERLLIESQSNCNRTCWFCPRTYDESGKYLNATSENVVKQMPTARIHDLLDQAQAMGFRGAVGFHHYSEPLLDTRNLQLAQAALDRGMKPWLHTNGDILKRSDALCDAVKEVYGLIVMGLYDYETNAELEVAKRYWNDRLAGATIEFSAIRNSGPRTVHSMGIPRALVPTDAHMVLPDLTYDGAPCHRPLLRLIIQYDGEMCACCEDTYGDFDLGNAFHQTLRQLWYSEPHIRMTEDLIAGRRDRYSLCRNCPMAPTGPSVSGTGVSIRPRKYRVQQV